MTTKPEMQNLETWFKFPAVCVNYLQRPDRDLLVNALDEIHY
ncbi:hypothetical protein [Leptolyngbya sp. 'hensonii']|nr:hypothetical protein [Leptolyngbya sp. 'hensonii']